MPVLNNSDKFPERVAQGLVTDWQYERHYSAGNIGLVEQPLWSGGRTTYQFLAAPEQLSIVSTSLDDAVAGLGAQSIKIVGLKNGKIIKEVVALNGLTAVLTSQSFDFVTRSYVYSAGSALAIPAIIGSAGALGSITISGSVTLNVMSVIAPGENVSLQTMIRVPIAEDWQLIDTVYTAGKGQEMTFRQYIKLPSTGIWQERSRIQLIQGSEVVPEHTLLPGGCEMIYTGITSAGTVETSIMIQILRKNAVEPLW